MFFVLSTGRSGTKTIARTLSMIPGCICLHEPTPELILESSAYRYNEIEHAKIGQILRETRPPTLNGSIYCESNQVLSLIIPLLANVFPEARYIWLIRNGLDMVASAYQKQWYTGHSENHDLYEDCSPIEKAWIDGRIQGDRCGDMTSTDWTNLDRFGRCCWYWQYVNRTIENDLQEYASDQYFFLRLEHIEEELEPLIEWMGLKTEILPEIKYDNLAKRIPYHWTEWSIKERMAFAFWCGDLMDRFYPSWRIYTGPDSRLFVAPAFSGLKRKLELAQKELNAQKEQLQIQNYQLQQYQEQLHLQGERTKSLTIELNSLTLQINQFQHSRSWRFTAPFRKIATVLRGLRKQDFGSRLPATNPPVSLSGDKNSDV